MWRYWFLAGCCLSLWISNTVSGLTVAAKPGEDKMLQWNMISVPSPSHRVTVLHPSGSELFAALGTTTITWTDFGTRVTNMEHTNTYTGHIEFTLKRIKMTDAGDYIMRYYDEDTDRTLQLVGVTLYVYGKPAKPMITEKIPPVVHNTMTLNCSTMSRSMPRDNSLEMRYYWYINGTGLLLSAGRYYISGSQLKVTNIQKTDTNTRITCRAYENLDIPSNLSGTYTVAVQYGPDIVMTNATESYTLVANKDTSGPISCSADCVPTCIYQWKFDDADIDSQNGFLYLNNPHRTVAGTYWCEAANDYGNARSKSFVVIVNRKPTQPMITEKIPPVVNNTMTLNCSTMSRSMPRDNSLEMRYYWYINGTGLLLSAGRYNISGSQLRVTNIQKTDTNTRITCRAYENLDIPSDLSGTYTVEVQYGPDRVMTNATEPYTLVANKDTSGPISCSADCVPTCIYQWKFNDADIDSQNGYLHLNNPHRTVAGTYWCEAANDYGNARSKSFVVIVNQPPDSKRSGLGVVLGVCFGIGGIGVIVALIVITIVCRKRRRQRQENSQNFQMGFRNSLLGCQAPINAAGNVPQEQQFLQALADGENDDGLICMVQETSMDDKNRTSSTDHGDDCYDDNVYGDSTKCAGASGISDVTGNFKENNTDADDEQDQMPTNGSKTTHVQRI